MITARETAGRAPDIAVALHALEADATRWTAAASDLRAAAAVAAGLVVPDRDFSVAGSEVGGAYETLRGKTATLLRQGADNFDAVATALRKSAQAYAAEEAARTAGLRGPR